MTGGYLLGVLALMAVCGQFGAYVALQKGRPTLEGLVFGAVLGPFGVIAVGLLPTLEEPPAKAGADEATPFARPETARGPASLPTVTLESPGAPPEGVEFDIRW